LVTNPAGPRRLYLIQERTATVATEGRPMAMSAGCYLLEMGDGTHVLVDSGSPPETNPPDGVAAERRRDVVEQLAQLDVRPEDVSVVICSHFDVDHAGNHDHFREAEFVVQRSHYERARNGDERFAAARSHWDHPDLRYRLVDGDLDLMPGVSLIETSGHTVGHQSVALWLPKTGPVLLAVDAVSMEASFTADRKAWPMDEDETELRTSTRKLLDLVERQQIALVVFHHDGRQWEGLKKAPDYYE
jgi:N-acyl homoserine lactone hydrolase